jgi:hypothetical protein
MGSQKRTVLCHWGWVVTNTAYTAISQIRLLFDKSQKNRERELEFAIRESESIPKILSAVFLLLQAFNDSNHAFNNSYQFKIIFLNMFLVRN